MPLRFYYLVTLYHSVVAEDLIYKDNEIDLPALRFFVFYHEIQPCPEKTTLKLTNFFSESTDIELNVPVYNVNYNKNFQLLCNTTLH